MKSNNTIAVLDDDHYLLALLKGYCYASNIGIEVFEFNRSGIFEARRLKPQVIAAPLDYIADGNNPEETALLKQISAQDKIEIIALNKCLRCHDETDYLDWIGAIIENPYEIGEIDAYLKRLNLNIISPITNLAGSPEKRSGADRRQLRVNVNGETLYNDRRINGDRRAYGDRRNHPGANSAKDSQEQLFHIDQRNKCLFVKGQKVELTPKEFELLLFLSTDLERVFTPDEIINHLWPDSQRATKSDLYQYMHLLRKKIEPDPNSPQWIRNIKGFGYKLEMCHAL